MKQIQTCLDRAFQKQSPLKHKWRAVIGHAPIINHQWLILRHYHHIILVYDLDTNEIVQQWWELPADKRGLDAALAYLEKRKNET